MTFGARCSVAVPITLYFVITGFSEAKDVIVTALPDGEFENPLDDSRADDLLDGSPEGGEGK
eukprot:SAG22_NODE_1565_length_4111_cov_2.333749_3_plen_62_part_00